MIWIWKTISLWITQCAGSVWRSFWILEQFCLCWN